MGIKLNFQRRGCIFLTGGTFEFTQEVLFAVVFRNCHRMCVSAKSALGLNFRAMLEVSTTDTAGGTSARELGFECPCAKKPGLWPLGPFPGITLWFPLPDL